MLTRWVWRGISPLDVGGQVLAAAALGVLLAGCGRAEQRRDEPATRATILPAVPVRVAVAKLETREQADTATGTVQPKLRARVSAKVSGTIAEFAAVAGRSVKQGEFLLRVSADEIQAQLDQAQAQRAKLEKDLGRTEGLVKEKMAAQQELDDALSAVKVAKGKVAEIETMLGYTKVVAPFDGVITQTLADKGDLATPGKPLLELEDPKTLRLEAFIPEATAGSLKQGTEYAVRIDGANLDTKAVLAEIAPTADPSSRTFLAKFDLPLSDKVRSGQFGRVQIPVSRSEVLRVPVSAVILRGQLEMVFVVNAQNVAEMHLVKTGKRDAGRVDILSGINPGEKVVTEGAATLVDRQAVTVLAGKVE